VSRHPLGAHVGRYLFLRNRGREYAEIAKGWMTPVAAVTAAAKYLGLDAPAAMGVGLAVPVVVETLALAIGWWDVRHGGLERQTQLVNEQDPYKVESLALLRKIARSSPGSFERAVRERMPH